MPSPSIQISQGINLETLEALMDQGSTEDKRSVKNRIANQHQKAMLLIDQRLHQLEEQKKNQWRGALFGFFVQVLSQAAQALNFLAPGLGVLVSTGIGMLEKINPFSHKAQDAQLDSEKIQGEIQREESKSAMAQDYLKRLEEHERRMEQRLSKVREHLENSQEAAVRI